MKVFPFKIIKTGIDSIIYQEDREVMFYNKLHQHEETQISYIEKGEGTLLVGDTITEYQKGDIVVIGSNLPHVFRSDIHSKQSSIMITVFFSNDSFGKDFFNLPTFKTIQPFFENCKTGFIVKDCSKKVIKCFKKNKTENKFDRFITFLETIKNLNQANKNPLSSYVHNKKITDDEGKRIQNIFEYVMNNYQKNISLEEISSIANMTKTSFCRYFRGRTKKSFFQFLIEIRIEHAGRLLLKKNELSVIEIAELCGFNNVSNFNRKFREIKNSSPLQYKKLNT